MPSLSATGPNTTRERRTHIWEKLFLRVTVLLNLLREFLPRELRCARPFLGLRCSQALRAPLRSRVRRVRGSDSDEFVHTPSGIRIEARGKRDDAPCKTGPHKLDTGVGDGEPEGSVMVERAQLIGRFQEVGDDDAFFDDETEDGAGKRGVQVLAEQQPVAHVVDDTRGVFGGGGVAVVGAHGVAVEPCELFTRDDVCAFGRVAGSGDEADYVAGANTE